MRLRKIVRIFLCAALLTPPVAAFETDQYNLPPAPLADISVEVSEYAEQNLRTAVDKINGEIAFRQSCLENSRTKSKKLKCGSADEERVRLSYLRSEAAVAREVYKLLGAGTVPFTKSGDWMESHRFDAQPARYKTGYRKSVFAVFPTNYLTISSTVNIYNSQFGTDKIAHFFQQGYDYYKIYNRALGEKSTTAEATRKAVRFGRKTEKTYFGTLISGVYSNADLYSNFVGMKFYQGLTREIKIGENTRPAILFLKNGSWAFDENVDLSEMLVKPFISNHLNEALNPSVFIKALRSSVRRAVRKQACGQWFKQFPNLSQTELNETQRALKLWHGEDYGFKESANFVTIANTCFDTNGEKIKN
ncbi:MAG: hypothetical protein M3525_14665 [Acidobacteriota bacterium]|nr:hypothetical protein [Acidobacteriota bacterium]